MTAHDLRPTIEAIWRIESARLIASLARIVRDVGVAEELAQDAFLAALEQWPAAGVPERPGAWLMGSAKHRAVDHLRRAQLQARKHAELAGEADVAQGEANLDLDAALDDAFGDDVLRLMFTACHPVLSTDARVTLTLRLVGGLTTEEIARAFLLGEPTVAQRLVRAKRTLAGAGVGFDAPRGPAIAERLASVLEVLYLIFNEGYAATAGDDWMRPALSADAMRLGRLLAERLPEAAEVHGLVALMELTAARNAARTGPGGEPVLLLDQQRSRWDRLLIRRGLAALARAEALGGAGGPYALQASIAACHARAKAASDTDWPRIAALYTLLAKRLPSPVVELNRAVAVGMAIGPAPALAIVDELARDPRLARYALLPSVRGDLLAKLGRNREARSELERAATLTENAVQRRMLLAKAATLNT